jgi:hypothetical protein
MTHPQPDTRPPGEEEPPHQAKVGVVDAGHNVTTALNEPVNGLLADLADGDA